MSCQQVTRLIPSTATKTPVTSEDPYVFTETVPTTPPILFNTQKSRARVVTDSQLTAAVATTTTITTQANATAKLKFSQKSPLTPLNGYNNTSKNIHNNQENGTKTQASLAAVHAASNKQNNLNNSRSASPALKHATQSQQKQHLQQNKKPLNVCIVRPQLQQQPPTQLQLQPQPQPQPPSSQPSQLQQKALQSRKQTLSPPPLLQHTPSLWQTPLLLDTTSAGVSPPTSPASLPSPSSTQLVTVGAASVSAGIPVAVTTANGTATALVAPLMSTAAAPLPPSKFHHTTLAQHLQKVQCIKKPKKPAITATAANNGVDKPQIQAHMQTPPKEKESSMEAKVLGTQKPASTPPKPLPPATARVQLPPPPPLQAFEAPQHSDSELNEIPVNVIFRKPRTELATEQNDVLKQQSSTSVGGATPAANKLKNVKIITPTVKATPTPLSLPPALAPTSLQNNLTTAPNVLRDIVFVHPNGSNAASDYIPKRDTSSKTSTQQPVSEQQSLTVGMSPAQKVIPNIVAKLVRSPLQEKPEQTELNFVTPIKSTGMQKTAFKRKAISPAVALVKGQSALSPFTAKRSRKLSCLFPVGERHVPHMNTSGNGNDRAVAVVKMSAAEVDADISVLASTTVLPYCVQQNWVSIYANVATQSSSLSVSKVTNNGVSCFSAAVAPNVGREERIIQHKALLRRQALQLLATRSLQKLPLQAARRRLLCVDRLLRKYQNHSEDDLYTAKRCVVNACTRKALEMASHCDEHIVNNATQHIFLPCTAKCTDNTQCRVPVFDITHDLPLCVAHAHKREFAHSNSELRPQNASVGLPSSFNYDDELQRQQLLRQQYQQQLVRMQSHHNVSNQNNNKKLVGPRVTQTRKRKAVCTNTVGRPQKRTKKVMTVMTTVSAPTTKTTNTVTTEPVTQLTSAVMQRKSSTTSLESIASNSQSSNSLPHYMPPTKLALPALAPLSNGGSSIDGGVQRTLNFGSTASMHSDNVECDLKAHEINQIMAQLVVANNNNNSCENSYSNSTYPSSNSNNNNSMNFMHVHGDSNFTSALDSSMSLPTTTEDLLRQELLSVCENSSAYASSEDTGLGGLSETELMGGAHDADDIPLVDSGLLEEHDLANALSALPEDVFNEIFTAVHQEERDEVERALEIADKHLKSLQQTIGSDIDFLGDFDVHDEILADTDMCSKMGTVSSMMHSPDTSGIDTSTLFIDSGSNSVGGGSASATGSCHTVADIRGLVQT